MKEIYQRHSVPVEAANVNVLELVTVVVVVVVVACASISFQRSCEWYDSASETVPGY